MNHDIEQFTAWEHFDIRPHPKAGRRMDTEAKYCPVSHFIFIFQNDIGYTCILHKYKTYMDKYTKMHFDLGSFLFSIIS